MKKKKKNGGKLNVNLSYVFRIQQGKPQICERNCICFFCHERKQNNLSKTTHTAMANFEKVN